VTEHTGCLLLAFANFASVQHNVPTVFDPVNLNRAKIALGPFHGCVPLLHGFLASSALSASFVPINRAVENALGCKKAASKARWCWQASSAICGERRWSGREDGRHCGSKVLAAKLVGGLGITAKELLGDRLSLA